MSVAYSSSVAARSHRWEASVDEVTEAEWNRLLPLFSDSNIYQSWAYGAVAWGEKHLSHLVLRHGDDAVGAAQLRIETIPMVGGGIAYVRWGPLWRRKERSKDPEILSTMARALVEEYVRKRGFVLRVIPNAFQEDSDGLHSVTVFNDCGMSSKEADGAYHTIRVDLRPGEDERRKKLDQKWRNQLNAAERNGLEIREGSSLEMFDKFLSIYDELMGRKQFETTVNPRAFRKIQARLPDSQKMTVLLAEKEGQTMCGVIGSCMGETGSYLLGATSNAGLKTKGSYLLQWRMMSLLRERGCRWYDLGGVNPVRNPGVYHFKKGFGGEEVWQVRRMELPGSLLGTLFVHTAESAARIASRLARPRKRG